MNSSVTQRRCSLSSDPPFPGADHSPSLSLSHLVFISVPALTKAEWGHSYWFKSVASAGPWCSNTKTDSQKGTLLVCPDSSAVSFFHCSEDHLFRPSQRNTELLPRAYELTARALLYGPLRGPCIQEWGRDPDSRKHPEVPFAWCERLAWLILTYTMALTTNRF